MSIKWQNKSDMNRKYIIALSGFIQEPIKLPFSGFYLTFTNLNVTSLVKNHG